jgi:hypothetical protein
LSQNHQSQRMLQEILSLDHTEETTIKMKILTKLYILISEKLH